MRKFREKFKVVEHLLVLGFAGLAGLSCSMNLPGAGGRIGCTPVKNALTEYLGEDAMKKERGIAYTCKAGHIDIAHLRDYAEWTEAYFKIFLNSLKKEEDSFLFNSKEPVEYRVKIRYPVNWRNLDKIKKEKIIEDVAIESGAYSSYISSIMHELLTWFDWRSTFIIPEFSSAFSWEDRYSDTLGCYIGALALKDKEHQFKDALNILLDKELKRLGIQSKEICRKAIKSVEGRWYKTGGIAGYVLRRNFDIGENDNQISPCIPLVEECSETDFWKCPIPQLQSLKKEGFEVQFLIKPLAKKGKFLKILGKDTISSDKDFSVLIEYVKREAEDKKYSFIE